MQIPTEQDWANPYGDLDIACAKKSFFGKTLEEAEVLFVENSLCYQEDILFMPSIPFRYYVHAYMNYLLSDQSKDDTEGASCFLMIIEHKIEFEHEDPLAVWSRIKETIEHIRNNPDWFDWNEAYHGNCEEKTTRLLSWDGQAKKSPTGWTFSLLEIFAKLIQRWRNNLSPKNDTINE
jgi:hypothetical protein